MLQILLDLSILLLLSFVLGALLLLLVSIIFQCRWAVPFVPTPTPVVNSMITLARLQPHETVLDLGAGDARFLLRAKAEQSSIHAMGYEGAVVVWFLGKLRIFFSRHRDIVLRCRNFFRANFSDADVIFLYLSIHVMKLLMPKFQSELRPGTRIISHAFRLPDLEPVETKSVPMRFGGSVHVYAYVWK